MTTPRSKEPSPYPRFRIYNYDVLAIAGEMSYLELTHARDTVTTYYVLILAVMDAYNSLD